MTIPRAGQSLPAKQYRLACGHFAVDDDCTECEGLGGSPDPWVVAEDPNVLNRLDETRQYRQSKASK